jgi:NAD(P)-dependent dehydrogenase (short-subunit alcohol dehydrogenase family)
MPPDSPTALITGAARRIGRDMALSLARAGWDVVIHYRESEQDAQSLAGEIRAIGQQASLIACDLTDREATASLFAELARRGLHVDCLINNASRFEKDGFDSYTSASLDSHMQVNFYAPLMLMRDFARQYRGASGVIINITDGMEGWSMSSNYLSYFFSKKSLTQATVGLALELAPAIRVNAIAPGPTLEGMQDKPDTFAKLREHLPLKCTSSPQEVCDALHYLLNAKSVTGQVILLSGGIHLCG